MVSFAQDLDQVHIYIVKVVEDALNLLYQEVRQLLNVGSKLDAKQEFELFHGIFRWTHNFEFHEQTIKEVIKFDQIKVDICIELLLDDILSEDFTEVLSLGCLLLLVGLGLVVLFLVRTI